MSQNRSDWFNPNNSAYRIRQSQINRYSYSPYSANYHTDNYKYCRNYNSHFENKTPLTVPTELKKYLSLNEDTEDLKLTMEGLKLILDLAKRTEENMRSLGIKSKF